MRNTIWCLVNFLKGKLRPKFEQVKVICATLSETLQRTQQPTVIAECLEGISLFLDDNAEV